jgi:hypothetical protein
VKNDAVVDWVTIIVRREGGITEKTQGIIVVESDGVDVEGESASFAKRALHVVLPAVSWSNIVIHICILESSDVLRWQAETESSFGKMLVQNSDLLMNLGNSAMYYH